MIYSTSNSSIDYAFSIFVIRESAHKPGSELIAGSSAAVIGRTNCDSFIRGDGKEERKKEKEASMLWCIFLAEFAVVLREGEEPFVVQSKDWAKGRERDSELLIE